jgi:hypothetical protein
MYPTDVANTTAFVQSHRRGDGLVHKRKEEPWEAEDLIEDLVQVTLLA